MSPKAARRRSWAARWSCTTRRSSAWGTSPSSAAGNTQSPVSPPPACWRRSGYMMTGSPVSWCGSDGSWSPAWALVSCSRSCSYPGATIHGTINPVHFYYSPGQTVTYTCSEVSPWSPGHHRHLLCPGLPAGGQACAHVRRGGRLGRGAAQVCRQENLNMVSPQTSG